MASFELSSKNFPVLALEVIEILLRENRILRGELNMFTDHNYVIPSDQRSVLTSIGIPSEMMNINDLVKIMKEYRFRSLMTGFNPEEKPAMGEKDVEKVLPPAPRNDRVEKRSIFSPMLSPIKEDSAESSSGQENFSSIPPLEELAIAEKKPTLEVRLLLPSACQNDRVKIPSIFSPILHTVEEDSTKLSSDQKNAPSLLPVKKPEITQETPSVEIILNTFARRPPLLSPLLSPCKEIMMERLPPTGQVISNPTVQKLNQEIKSLENTKQKMSQSRRIEEAPRNAMRDEKSEKTQVSSKPMPFKRMSSEKPTPATLAAKSTPLQSMGRKRANTFTLESMPAIPPATPAVENSPLQGSGQVRRRANSFSPSRVNKNTRCLNCRCKGHNLDSCNSPILQCTRCLKYRHLAEDCRSS